MEREKRKGATTEGLPEDSVEYFHNVINSTLVVTTLDADLDARKMVGSKEEQGKDALSMDSTSFKCNPQVQINIAMRNNLQYRMGDSPRMTEEGKMIN